jgi:hypothetical protein
MDNLHEQMDEIREYNELLETVLLALCEELDLDPQALVEDVMTVARQKEHHKKLNPLYKKNAKIGYNAPEEKKIEKQIEKARYGRGGYSTEMRSKKLYGRGGKVLKRKPTNRDVHAGADNDERGYTD